jgi:hypothetical protein
MPQQNLTGMFGRRERCKRRADDLNGGSDLIDWTPGGYEARIAMKAWTAAAFITDHKREAVAGRIPYLDVLDWSDDATELHGASQKSLAPNDVEQRLGPGPGFGTAARTQSRSCEGCVTAYGIRFVIPNRDK